MRKVQAFTAELQRTRSNAGEIARRAQHETLFASSAIAAGLLFNNRQFPGEHGVGGKLYR